MFNVLKIIVYDIKIVFFSVYTIFVYVIYLYSLIFVILWAYCRNSIAW